MTMFVVLNIVLPALAVIVLLGVHWFVAKEFYAAAVMKGWTEKKYLYLAFLLWIVGYILIVALPDRGADKLPAAGAVVSDDLPEL